MRREDKFCVWVLELAILTVSLKRIAYWEVWEAFNTRSEAVAGRDRQIGKFEHGKVPKSMWRIRKYVPA